MDLIRVKENFELPSGVPFKKGETFWGHWNYVSSIDKITELPLVVIVCQHRGTRLLHKDDFELAKAKNGLR